MDLEKAVITRHAVEQMGHRQISLSYVRNVLSSPETVMTVRPGRLVAQGMVDGYLLRIFVDTDRDRAEVVTVYRTSKVTKYRSPG